MPGCTATVWHCDADHALPHAHGGLTDPVNCGLLCHRHHRLKTFHAWTWTRDQTGTTTWTDPTGRHWRRPPATHPTPPRPDVADDAPPDPTPADKPLPDDPPF